MDKELLDILCCPETRQDLHLAGPDQLRDLNAAIARGVVRDAQGRTVAESVDEALVRQDGLRAYAVRRGIPILLSDEALVLEGI
ncbi:MAG TPA: hypothetical protein VN931_07140 [Fibrobacteria bacterium]|nr:hypothetical protein [Fibrobacteria bacterium]